MLRAVARFTTLSSDGPTAQSTQACGVNAHTVSYCRSEHVVSVASAVARLLRNPMKEAPVSTASWTSYSLIYRLRHSDCQARVLYSTQSDPVSPNESRPRVAALGLRSSGRSSLRHASARFKRLEVRRLYRRPGMSLSQVLSTDHLESTGVPSKRSVALDFMVKVENYGEGVLQLAQELSSCWKLFFQLYRSAELILF